MYRDLVFKQSNMVLRNAILQEIKKDRDNDITDKDLIKEAIQQYLYMAFDKLANI